MNDSFGHKIAKLCHEHYTNVLPRFCKSLPVNGGTHVAAIVMCQRSITDISCEKFTVVSMATGSKCIGKNSMNNKGSVVNDSHAEVLCRRAFIRYLYYQLNLALSVPERSDVVELSSCKTSFNLKSGVDFHLYSSCIPCGDAAIFPKILEDTNDNADDSQNASKRLKTSTGYRDIYRTGAKCCGGGPQDPHEPGENYHIVGALRTKPGRGDPTISMSCSDKIARWNVLGLQGALLSSFLVSPIFFNSITIASNRCHLDSLRRAVIGRIDGTFSSKFPRSSDIKLFHVEDFIITDPEIKPPPTALFWSDVPSQPLEVIVNGFKQGATQKLIDADSPKVRCAVSRYELFKQFHFLRYRLDQINNIRESNFIGKSYVESKIIAKDYQEAKSSLLSGVFSAWTKKHDEFQQFSLHPADIEVIYGKSAVIR
ncbi:tRNA-specific adenosine deaminase 1 [Chamberlinius hualienensis]